MWQHVCIFGWCCSSWFHLACLVRRYIHVTTRLLTSFLPSFLPCFLPSFLPSLLACLLACSLARSLVCWGSCLSNQCRCCPKMSKVGKVFWKKNMFATTNWSPSFHCANLREWVDWYTVNSIHRFNGSLNKANFCIAANIPNTEPGSSMRKPPCYWHPLALWVDSESLLQQEVHWLISWWIPISQFMASFSQIRVVCTPA